MWTTIKAKEAPLLPRYMVGHCVYALFVRSTCVYIGQSIRLRARLRQHLQLNSSVLNGFDRELITIRYKFSTRALWLEDKLIQRLRPLGNKSLNPNRAKYIGPRRPRTKTIPGVCYSASRVYQERMREIGLL